MTPAEIISTGLSTASVIVSTASLIITYNLYRKFLNQKVNEYQLGLVIDFIKELNSSRFSAFDFEIQNDRVTDIAIANDRRMTFTDVVAGHIVFSGFKDGKTVYRDNNYRCIIPSPIKFSFLPLSFLSNPVFPNEIAKELRYMADNIKQVVVNHSNVSKFVAITQSSNISRQNLPKQMHLSMPYCYEYTGGLDNFIQTCKRIDNATKQWLKSHEITDTNNYVLDTADMKWD